MASLRWLSSILFFQACSPALLLETPPSDATSSELKGACPDELDVDLQGDDERAGLSLLQRNAHATAVSRETSSARRSTDSEVRSSEAAMSKTLHGAEPLPVSDVRDLQRTLPSSPSAGVDNSKETFTHMFTRKVKTFNTFMQWWIQQAERADVRNASPSTSTELQAAANALQNETDKSDFFSLHQNNMTLKLGAHQEAQSSSTGVVFGVVLLIILGLCIATIFFAIILRESADSEIDKPPMMWPQQPSWNAGSAPQSAMQSQSSPYAAQSLLRSSPPAPAVLPRNSPPQSMVLPQRPKPAPAASSYTGALPTSASSAASSSQGLAVPAGHGEEIARFVEPAPPGDATIYPKAPMTSTAIIVRSPEGVILHPDVKCLPHPEQILINFTSLKGANAVVRARIDELGGQSQITVESASGIPLALIDTGRAIYPPTRDPPPRDSRMANIHRVAGSSFQLLGSPCATVLSVTPSTFVVLNAISGSALRDLRGTVHQLQQHMQSTGFALRPDVLLTVKCDEYGSIDEMRDGRGGIVARAEGLMSSHGAINENIWASQGADITLIVSVVLAVWKLA